MSHSHMTLTLGGLFNARHLIKKDFITFYKWNKRIYNIYYIGFDIERTVYLDLF